MNSTKAQLTCLYDGCSYEISEGKEIIIGREVDCEEGNIKIEENTVSKKHAIIRYKDGFKIEDLESKNGTYINNIRIRAGNIEPIEDGDIITFAKIRYRFSKTTAHYNLGEIYGLPCEYVKTIGGKKLSFDIKNNEVINFQRKMIEENTHLGILDSFYVGSIKKNCLFFNTTEYVSLKALLYQDAINAEALLDLIEKIIIIVKQSEKYMLDIDKFILTEETIFLKENLSEARLIYLPIKISEEHNFYLELQILLKNINSKIIDNKGTIYKLIEQMQKIDNKTAEIHKLIIKIKEVRLNDDCVIESDKKHDSMEKMSNEKKVGKINPIIALSQILKNRRDLIRAFLPCVSFILIMMLYWIDLLGIVDIIGLIIIIGAFNVLIFRYTGLNKKEFEKKEK